MSASTLVIQPVQSSGWKFWSLPLAIGVLVTIPALPMPAGLPVAGRRVLAAFGFAVVVWPTEAPDYAVSAVVIAALPVFLLGMAYDLTRPIALISTGPARTLPVSGLGNTVLTPMLAALFLATAMTSTGLDRRIALRILSLGGVRTSRVVIGSILVTIV